MKAQKIILRFSGAFFCCAYFLSNFPLESSWTQLSQANSHRSMTIFILSMDRFSSLCRLLSSLQTAEYENDNIDLVVRFDQPRVFSETKQQWTQNVDDFRGSLRWDHGEVSIYVSNSSIGLRESWFQAWKPTTDDDRAVILEDDLELSPVWYQWLKRAHDAYDHRDDLGAYSLSHQTLVPLKTSTKTTKEFPDDQPFLYALLGSHGFSPLARIWMEFLDFVRCYQQREDAMTIATPELVTSDWYFHVHRKESMWEQHFIYFCQQRNLYHVYQFTRDKALAAHWEEKGKRLNILFCP